MSCEPCAFAKVEGWWGETLPTATATHCKDCHDSWPGTQTWGHCTKCHWTYRGIQSFDHHQEAGMCVEPGQDVEVEWIYAGQIYALQDHPWGLQFFACIGRKNKAGVVTMFNEEEVA